jgi:hypothetical protein
VTAIQEALDVLTDPRIRRDLRSYRIAVAKAVAILSAEYDEDGFRIGHEIHDPHECPRRPRGCASCSGALENP